MVVTRTVGQVSTARSLGSHDHLCWVFDDTDALVDAVHDFLVDGLLGGRRVGYVGSLGADQVRRVLNEQAARLGRHDAVFVRDTVSMYGSGEVVAPERQVSAYRAATDQAIADGYIGLRVAADATSLVRTPAQLGAFVQYEYLIDREMTDCAFSAMCAYDRRILGDAADDMAASHPVCNSTTCGFAMYAAVGADLSVRGELDLFEHDRFERILSRVGGVFDRRDLVIDATGLAFVDHRALLAIRAYVQARGVSAMLRVPENSVVPRLVDLMGLSPDVRVAEVA